MLVENLIKQLQKFPKRTSVCILDYRKNLGDSDEDGSSVGIYPSFEIDSHTLEPDEEEYYNERNDTKFKPWISLSFINEDYDKDGNLITE